MGVVPEEVVVLVVVAAAVRAIEGDSRNSISLISSLHFFLKPISTFSDMSGPIQLVLTV